MSASDIAVLTIEEIVQNNIALISKSQAAEYLGLAQGTIINKVHAESLKGFMVSQTEGGRKALYVTAGSAKVYKQEIENFVNAVEKIVYKLCRQHETMNYATLMKKFDLDSQLSNDRKVIASALGVISTRSQAEYGVMVSAVIVGQNTGIPSSGFFDLATYLGVTAEPSKKWLETYLKKIEKSISGR